MTHESDLFGPVISSYTRADAIADGALIDVTDVAAEAGFTLPVAVTLGVWEDCVAWDAETEDRKAGFTGQDESARLWDVLTMARFGTRRAGSRDRVQFPLHRVPLAGNAVNPRWVTLEVMVGPGDNAEAVITIIKPGED